MHKNQSTKNKTKLQDTKKRNLIQQGVIPVLAAVKQEYKVKIHQIQSSRIQKKKSCEKSKTKIQDTKKKSCAAGRYYRLGSCKYRKNNKYKNTKK